jgi:hypothetical protein
MARNILTIFAGRKENIEISIKYLKKLLQLGFIHEVHFWNYTRKASDEQYLESISNLKRTSSTLKGRYIKIHPLVEYNSFSFTFKPTKHICVRLNYKNISVEIIITDIIQIKKNDVVICMNDAPKYDSNDVKVNIRIDNHYLHLSVNDTSIFINLLEMFIIQDIYVKSGNGSVGILEYKTVENKGFYFMDTCEKKPWHNYYWHYISPEYKEDIIIKCDDDIIYIDIDRFQEYIQFVRTCNYDLCFANTINNGVAAHYQQDMFNLIPKSLLNLEYPPGGFQGSLWNDGKKAELMHKYFLDNIDSFIKKDYSTKSIEITTRYSINFFAMKGSNWEKIQFCGDDDEKSLTVFYVDNGTLTNVLYTPFYVSHLSFCQQEAKINNPMLRQLYNAIAPVEAVEPEN